VTDSTGQGRVLVVCTGNVCRSPYLERILRRDLTGTRILVGSAGTGALVGKPMDPTSAALLEAKGLGADDFVARALTPELVRDADLVIGAAREHVDTAARMFPKALRYAFALRDLADLLDGLTAEELAETSGDNPVARVAAAAVGRRGTIQPRTPEESTIVDPFRQGRHVFDKMADQIRAALPPVVSALRLAADGA
jgi:protein-tyrosine phosphatase